MATFEIYGALLRSNVDLPGFRRAPRTRPIDIDVRFGSFPYQLRSVPGERLFERRSLNAHPSSWVDRSPQGDYWIHYEEGIQFLVSHNGSAIWATWPEPYTAQDSVVYLPGGPVALALRLQGQIALHGSVVDVGDGAIGFLGVGGSGKSTIAAAWALSGMKVLSDDLLVLRTEGTNFRIEPGATRVRLWPDAAEGLLGASTESLPQIVAGWDKKYLDLEKLGLFADEALPLKALYALGDTGGSRLEPMTGRDRLLNLVANCYTARYTDSGAAKEEFDLMNTVNSRVPMKRLRLATTWAEALDTPRLVLSDLVSAGRDSA